MGDRFLTWLLNGMKRLHVALGSFWKWYTTPPRGAGQNGTYTDQW